MVTSRHFAPTCRGSAASVEAQEVELQHVLDLEKEAADMGMQQCSTCRIWLHDYSVAKHEERCAERRVAPSGMATLTPVETLILAAVHPKPYTKTPKPSTLNP